MSCTTLTNVIDHVVSVSSTIVNTISISITIVQIKFTLHECSDYNTEWHEYSITGDESKKSSRHCEGILRAIDTVRALLDRLTL